MDDPEAIAASLGDGRPLESAARSRMESALGESFAHVRVHDDARAAALSRNLDARAFTVGHHVAFAAGEYRPGTPIGDALVAHELAHVMQQAGAPAAEPRRRRSAEDPGGPLEAEADRTAGAAVASIWAGRTASRRRAARPALGGAMGLQRCGAKREKKVERPMTHDEMLVARAKLLLPILYRFVEEWNERGARRLEEKETREKMLAARKSIEDPLAEAMGRPAMEAATMKRLNRKPLRVEVTEDKVIFRVKFHARFEDPKQKKDFPKLKAGVEAAAANVWNRDADKVMVGKRFELIPEVTLVSETEPRSHDAWLIVVRASDKGPVAHPGCKLDDPRPVVAAVTDPLCDGGVMNLPPKSIGDGDLIGHEMLHLFGFVDRYLMITTLLPDKSVKVETTPTRETGGRRDPLGGEKGFILPEDLAFLFENLDIYDIEANRGLFTLRRLEERGLGISQVLGEIEHQKAIIRLGRDPRSLIQPRRDFRPELMKSVENL